MKVTLIGFCDGCGASLPPLHIDTAWLDDVVAALRDVIQRHRATVVRCPYHDWQMAKANP